MGVAAVAVVAVVSERLAALHRRARIEVGDEGGARWRVVMTTAQWADGGLQTVNGFSAGNPAVEWAGTHRLTGLEGPSFDLVRFDPSTRLVLRCRRVVHWVDAAAKP